MRGLFAGIQPSLLGTAVSQGVYFYLYSGLRQLAVSAHNAGRPAQAPRGGAADIGIAASLAVAALAGCGNTALTTPIWVVATRMQAHRRAAPAPAAAAAAAGSEQPGAAAGQQASAPPPAAPTAAGPLAVARELYQDAGVRGFWRGVLPGLVMVANPTIQYMLYEWLQARRNRLRAQARLARAKPGAGEIFLYASLAKLGATLATYPLLLVKTRMQNARGKGGGSGGEPADPHAGGTLHAIRAVYEREGLLGFYSGMHTKMLQSVLAAALLFLTKEEMTEAVRRALRGPPPALPRAAVVPAAAR